MKANPINDFTCEHPQCAQVDTMNFEGFKKHIAEVHGLTSKEDLSGSKAMLMHMDGDYWFSSHYRWTLKSGLQFSQFTKMARDKHDLMRF